MDILDVNRSNNSTQKNINDCFVSIAPVMFVKVIDCLQKQVLGNTWKLANMKDDIDGFGYYIKQSMPEPYRMVRAKHQSQFNKIKEEN